MSGERAHGDEGERIVERLLRYAGWTILDRQVTICGHRLDFVAERVGYGETLVEVKVWADPSKVGTDNIKKAIADAYDLRAAGEVRPYLLVLSHELGGLHRDMLHRAMSAGAIADVWVLRLVPIEGER